MIGSNHFYLSIKATSNYLLKVLLRCISCIIIDVFKVALLLCSDSCKIYIYRTATYISKKCNSYHSISISIVKLLPLTLYLHEFLLMIYYHHCNRLDQSCATEWISSDIFQVLPLTYNIFYTYLYKYIHSTAMTYSKFYCQWIQSIKSVAIDIFLVLLLIFSYYCYYYV